MFQYGDVIQGIGGVACGQTFHTDLKQVALLERVVTVVDAGYGIGDAVCGDIGQETQTAGVDTYHWYALAAHTGGSAEERAVTTNAYYGIGRKIITFNYGVIRYLQPE